MAPFISKIQAKRSHKLVVITIPRFLPLIYLRSVLYLTSHPFRSIYIETAFHFALSTFCLQFCRNKLVLLMSHPYKVKYIKNKAKSNMPMINKATNKTYFALCNVTSQSLVSMSYTSWFKLVCQPSKVSKWAVFIIHGAYGLH